MLDFNLESLLYLVEFELLEIVWNCFFLATKKS